MEAVSVDFAAVVALRRGALLVSSHRQRVVLNRNGNPIVAAAAIAGRKLGHLPPRTILTLINVSRASRQAAEWRMREGADKDRLAADRDGAAKVIEVHPIAGHELRLLGPRRIIGCENIGGPGLSRHTRLKVGAHGKCVAAEADTKAKLPA